MTKIISGIQQLGIGVVDTYIARDWYKENLGYDVVIFDEAAEANLMLQYTAGQPQNRHAILSYNMKGGGGFEIWQYTSRTPEPASFKPILGDLGINICKMKTRDIQATFRNFDKNYLISKPITFKWQEFKTKYYYFEISNDLSRCKYFDNLSNA